MMSISKICRMLGLISLALSLLLSLSSSGSSSSGGSGGIATGFVIPPPSLPAPSPTLEHKIKSELKSTYYEYGAGNNYLDDTVRITDPSL